MAEVELKGICKRYKDLMVVRDVDLFIKDNEFIVLVGPSGCGKSTTLRMVAGLETISSGEIRIGDRIVNQVPPKDRNIAMVFQNYALYPHMTVYHNMAFSLKMQKRPKDEMDQTVRQTAEMLGLTPLLDRKPAALSGGQCQRVAMGRAIVRRPAVFLFDEPLSNLDAQLRTQMRMELKKLHLKFKTTTIYVTHDQIEAMTLADRIVILKEGVVQQVGSPIEVYEAPSNAFVAGFIGNPRMNIMPGVVRLEGGNRVVDINGLLLPIPEDKFTKVGEGRNVLAGIRPEDIKVAGHVPDQPEAWLFEGVVEVAEIVGGQSLLEFNLGENKMVAELEGRILPVHGARMKIGLDLNRMHLFDPETTRALD